MQPIPFHTTDWSTVEETVHAGTTGTATWRTLQFDTVRVRMVVYSANYTADHWCTKGHILYCLKGEMVSELSDGRIFKMQAGMSYQVTDGQSSHRTTSQYGATLFIVDGDFLN